jgi:hypothetical protein
MAVSALLHLSLFWLLLIIILLLFMTSSSVQLSLLPPDLLPFKDLEQQRSINLRNIVSDIKKAYRLPSKEETIDALKDILNSSFSCPEALLPRHQSTIKSLKIEEIDDYDRFFHVQRIVSPSPLEAFIRAVLISQIVNWANTNERHDAALKCGFQEQITLIERVLNTPEVSV